jgi:hypothetical protein
MTNSLLEIEKVVEGRVLHIAEHPIPFTRFVEMGNGTIEGLTLQAEWILREPRPGVRATLNALFPSN